MMRKLIILVGMVIFMALLSGCALLRDLTIDERAETEAVAQQVVDALDARDADALKALLSPRSLEEAGDLDEGIAYIFSLYKGTYVRFEKHGNSYSDHYGDPDRTKCAEARYEVWTDKGYYVLRFELWLIEEGNPDKLGIYRMMLCTEEKEDESVAESRRKRDEAERKGEPLPEWNYGASYERPGIYHPGWDDAPGPSPAQDGALGVLSYISSMVRPPYSTS
jgi:hypothetical protein